MSSTIQHGAVMPARGGHPVDAAGSRIARAATNPWIIAATVMLATFMEVLDTSIANVALPHIAGNLSATVDEGTWVLTSYLVSNAIVLPLSGFFSSLFGRKRFYLICVVLFSVSSLLCGLAPNLELLIFFRVLQGIGGGALMPISQAILVETFPKNRQGIAMAIFGMGVMFAPVIGPTLGGWFTDNYSWRWIFFINIPVGALAFVLSQWLISDPPYLVRKKWGKELRIDYIGLGLVAVGLGFLQIVLDTGQKKDWFENAGIAWMSAIVVSSLATAVWWELRHRDPVVDLRLLGERNFAISSLTMFLAGFVVYGSIVLLPLYLQQLMGYSPTKAGLVMSPGGLAMVLAMPIVGVLLAKFEARWLVAAGLIVSAVGLFKMSGLNLFADMPTAVKLNMLKAVGEAMLFVPINAAAFYYVGKEHANAGTGLINLARNVGGSMGIAGVTTMLARRSQFHQSVLISHLTPMDQGYRELLFQAKQALIMKGSDPAQAAHQAQAMVYGMVQREAAMLSFVDCFWLLAIIYLALIPLMFLMKKTKPGGTVPGMH
jgi:DHA2 family multidrug resistance protein